jgi:hypothetical protein
MAQLFSPPRPGFAAILHNVDRVASKYANVDSDPVKRTVIRRLVASSTYSSTVHLGARSSKPAVLAAIDLNQLARHARGCWIFGARSLRGIHRPASTWIRDGCSSTAARRRGSLATRPRRPPAIDGDFGAGAAGDLARGIRSGNYEWVNSQLVDDYKQRLRVIKAALFERYPNRMSPSGHDATRQGWHPAFF